MPELPERTALHRLYDAKESEGLPPFLRQLYPQFLRYWQYLGTGTHSCRWGDSGYAYVPAEDEDAPLNYELKVRWPRDQYEATKTRTALYRLRDGSGRLLYVGISSSPLRRWPEHAADKSWWPEVSQFSVEWCGSREQALAAEAVAIQTEQPAYNVHHNGATVT